ncbi:RalF-like Dot/Icm system translocated protein [Nitzschia inconspicua]|uniref:RalF-like Dot/Icm system translocated protein n=1 Tax=Nitzschia inconspicua TaxID=303405 RepID=A0A9K3L9K6_9STRA|nr:RalF-like Dot/Icm system translocated protein [Nitzschia inconspicua]
MDGHSFPKSSNAASTASVLSPLKPSDCADEILEAARHLCQEASVVLTSLRGGPPNVARGDLAQDLMDLRTLVKGIMSTDLSCLEAAPITGGNNQYSSYRTNATAPVSPLAAAGLEPPSASSMASNATGSSTNATANNSSSPHPNQPEDNGSEGSSAVFVESPDPPPYGVPPNNIPQERVDPSNNPSNKYPPQNFAPVPMVPQFQDVGPYARPFLMVVMDPRAAGPHTLVALRALHRLLERNSLQAMGGSLTPRPGFGVAIEPLTKGVLNCKFEQTDAGADEAVEMAIADLLALMVSIDRRSIQTDTLMDAFNTVFVTRNTFVHSPALCYHFEDVLTTVVRTVFEDLDSLTDPAGRLILEFLVNQLLHTPLVGGDDEASREAQIAHDATRVLCLRLTRWALRCGFQDVDNQTLMAAAAASSPDDERGLLQIIQDDLCLSLLLNGQAIWAYQDNTSVVPGFISMEVLSEICTTLSTLWTSYNLRKHLVPQFEAIFTGFYQRALVLLRKRMNPTDSASFHANFVFDAGIEIILESLVDIMGLHDHRQTVAQGNGGCLESLFATYDCNIRHSDVAVSLMVELCRCTGSHVNEDGDVIDASLHGVGLHPLRSAGKEESATPSGSMGTPTNSSVSDTPESDSFSSEAFPTAKMTTEADINRQVPPHLKELCAQTIIGSMKCLFRDDHPSESTKEERRQRDSILRTQVSPAPQSFSDLERITSSHHLRNIKSKKRLLRKAARLFNEKSSKGIEFLVESGIIAEPVTPRSIASFLRNGIVVGLDKKAVGAYLGEIGKPAVAGKSPKVWERDYFHKEVLETYCSLFHFDRQSLLDGLRMFLACFRLPGEAQQIDRILQAFADSCGNSCEESSQGALKIFSEDPKRASDVAFLLSFSIIMLNTDQHNDNIREDRKMKKSDFVRNNTDYGKDITEPGRELPREYLEAIYDSIREEEIKTEGEGADGSMTVERWKDVLRGSAEDEAHADELPSVADAEDLSELVLEHVWLPILSSVSSLWGVRSSFTALGERSGMKSVPGSSGMHGAQGARLGMDLAWEMLVGVRHLGRTDIFNKIFKLVCRFTGLLDYDSNAADRAWAFSNSVEAQSAVIVAMKIVDDAYGDIDKEGWMFLFCIIFELRDLKMLGGGTSSARKSLLRESDPDILKEDTRRDWTMKLMKKGRASDQGKKSSGGFLSSMGRALFGSVEDPSMELLTDTPSSKRISTVHGKEDHLLWDEVASSDDEGDYDESKDDGDLGFTLRSGDRISLGTQFEHHLVQEHMLISQEREMGIPVTGLERVEDTSRAQASPRARVRKRLANSCDFVGLISDSRYMDDIGLAIFVTALLELIKQQQGNNNSIICAAERTDESWSPLNQHVYKVPLSPGSEAFAEVLVCEIALKNRDRFHMLWHDQLATHYYSRLKSLTETYFKSPDELLMSVSGGIEKSTTGLLRISRFAMKKGEIADDVLYTWTLLDKCEAKENQVALLDVFDRHIGEGVLRITKAFDGTTRLSERGWHAEGFAEDDPSLQAYRSIHLLLNSSEIKHQVPSVVGSCIEMIVVTGDRRNCSKLSIAGLDLLQLLSNGIEASAIEKEEASLFDNDSRSDYWKLNWVPVIESVARASRMSPNANVRQHALSMLTDSFLDKRGGLIPIGIICDVLAETCTPMAGTRIVEMRDGNLSPEHLDAMLIELELCIGLIFKPVRHHIKAVISADPPVLASLWFPTLDTLKMVMGEGSQDTGKDGSPRSVMVKTVNELTMDHLRNIITVMISFGVLRSGEEGSVLKDDISEQTWNAISAMEFCRTAVAECKLAAACPPIESTTPEVGVI